MHARLVFELFCIWIAVAALCMAIRAVIEWWYWRNK